MLLEPFGVLSLLPNTKNEYGVPKGWRSVWRHRLETFLPTYKATRVIVEVVAESTPQMVLQAYIFVRVKQHGDGPQPAAHAALEAQASILPISIGISALNLLKVWAELLWGARTAGVPLHAWLVQIWEMGAGKLPLDAIRRGTIDTLEWHFKPMPEDEWRMLLDALLQNVSLVELNLRGCKLKAEGGISLARALGEGAVPQLTTLWLTNNAIGDAGVTALAEACAEGKALAQLTSLDLFGNRSISEQSKESLKAALPECEVDF